MTSADFEVQAAPIVPEADAPKPVKRSGSRNVNTALLNEKRVRIILEEVENMPPTGQPVSVNGRAYIIKPGVPVDVPVSVVKVLENAVQMVPNIDPNTRQIRSWSKRMRFPFRYVSSHEPLAA